MRRANRLFLPGYVWHITHRCHRRKFLLKFPRDRQRWRYWLFETRKRFGLCVLNYTVTSNCMVYIDMNMVLAGAVSHPVQWDVCGYRKIQNPPQRYRIIDRPALMDLLGIRELNSFQQVHEERLEEALKAEHFRRDESWSESLTVGSRDFVVRFQSELGIGASHRDILQDDDRYRLRETPAHYSSDLGPKWPL